MKLLLTSNGLTNPSLEKEFLEMTGNKTDLRIAMIPTAGDPIEWVPLIEGNESYDNFVPKLIWEYEIEENTSYLYFKNKGYDIIIVDLKEDPERVKEKLQSVDVIEVGGGDINYLLDWAKKAKLDTYLKDLLDTDIVYIGTSAGSMLIQPDIGLTWWKPEMKADHEGLGIVDFLTTGGHGKDSDEENVNEIIERMIKRREYLQSEMNFPWKIYVVMDGQAIKVINKKIKHIWEWCKKYF